MSIDEMDKLRALLPPRALPSLAAFYRACASAVEAQLALFKAGADLGHAFPDFDPDETMNRIVERAQRSSDPEVCGRLQTFDEALRACARADDVVRTVALAAAEGSQGVA